MALSTEDTVRQVLVSAITNIGAQLGFSGTPNVKDYLLEFEMPGKETEYLSTDLEAGKRGIRAWGVDVGGTDDLFSTNSVSLRTYEIRIVGYYEVGVNGSGIKLLRKHARLIRGALFELGTDLKKTVRRTLGGTQLSVNVLRNLDAAVDAVLVGEMLLTAEQETKDFS
jgi:hypothetical protein